MLHAAFKFQSSPDPKAGRNGGQSNGKPASSGFQSSPDPKAGRNRVIDEEDRLVYWTFQSSPDPKVGRNVLPSQKATRFKPSLNFLN